MPALIVTGAQTVAFHRSMNEALLRTLRACRGTGARSWSRNSPAADPDHFVAEWQKFPVPRESGACTTMTRRGLRDMRRENPLRI